MGSDAPSVILPYISHRSVCVCVCVCNKLWTKHVFKVSTNHQTVIQQRGDKFPLEVGSYERIAYNLDIIWEEAIVLVGSEISVG